MDVIQWVANRIYALGETTGNVADMIAAEQKGADEIRQYVASGSTAGLLSENNDNRSPLVTAAYMGYPNIVAALLTSNIVKERINETDVLDMTPWIVANFSLEQSLWTCKPAVFDNPYKFVPMLMTQPYYTTNPNPPYKKTREVLKEAGASSDMAQIKEAWLTKCKYQSAETRAKVKASTDLQKTVQELGAADLSAQLSKLQKMADEARKK